MDMMHGMPAFPQTLPSDDKGADVIAWLNTV
jgi:hypothetical protein